MNNPSENTASVPESSMRVEKSDGARTEVPATDRPSIDQENPTSEQIAAYATYARDLDSAVNEFGGHCLVHPEKAPAELTENERTHNALREILRLP